MEVEVGGNITVSMPGQSIPGRVTRVDGNMVYAILNGQQCESTFLRDEVENA